MSEKANLQEFNALLDFLKRSRGFDFSGYKTTSLMRRIQKRMDVVKVERLLDYIDYLEVHPEEFVFLFNTILINVTSFFRDPAAWDYLRDQIIPAILKNKRQPDMIRIWSTGCASGEEAYSIAMLFCEALGEAEFRNRVKIYATDVDEDALNKARLGVYTEHEVEGIPAELLSKYFTHNEATYTFNREIRRMLIFGRNDLIQDAPISKVDLLVCRNTLMYFNAETQARILARFHFALNEKGYLFLGKAEMLLTHANTFTPVDVKLHIFRKVPRIDLRDRLLITAHTGNEDEVNHLFGLMRVRDAFIELHPLAQLVVDINNALLMINEQARSLFNLTQKDIGKPFQDLDFSHKSFELNSALKRVYAERIPIMIRNIEWPNPDAETRFYDVRIQPLNDNGNTLLGVGIIFTEVTPYILIERQLKQTKDELETTLQQLQSTNEELETTNEELQSTVEELETTNEELQSTNEELETMNEELQSTNEELYTLNEQLRQRTEELDQSNDFLECVLTSVQAGIVVMDRDLQIQIWNRKAEDLWGLRLAEVRDRYILNLDIGLPVEQLKKPFLSSLSGVDHREVILPARNRRGKDLLCKVTSSPLLDRNKEIKGVIALMEEMDSDR